MLEPVRLAAVGAVFAITLSPVASEGAGPLTGLKPAQPQPTASQLAPGLAVQYTYAIVNHIDDLKGRKFEAGPPLPQLNYRVGHGKVLTSKDDDGVGAIIAGFIHLEKPGIYGFDVTSNDGVRVEIGGQLLYEDPGVHGDDTSDRIDVKIDQPGWYPITVTYFEKRNTATLILRWAPPGSPKLGVVPAKAFGHLK